MRTAIQLLLIVGLFGGGSTAATLYWKKQQSELQAAIKRAEAAESKANESPLAGMEKPVEPPEAHDEPEPVEEPPEPPVAARPPFVEGVDETSQLVVSLNQRLRATHEKERKLNERQEALKLIFSDIRTEQVELNKLRQEVGDEIGKSSQSVREALKTVQDERDVLRQDLDQSSKTAQEALKAVQEERELLRQELESLQGERDPQRQEPDSQKSSPTKLDKLPADAASAIPPAKIDSDPATLKRLGAIYDNMPAEVVADVLQQLTKQGRDAAVVQIMQNMKDRQAAKVLATIATSDAAKAATLTELLKRK